MNEGKYVEAIAQLNEIDSEDVKIYNDAQNKIEQCKVQYAKQKFQLANNAIQHNEFKEAIKYIDDISKVDDNNKEANLLKAKVNIKIQQESLPYINKPKRSEISQTSSEVTPKEAVEIVKKLMNDNLNIKWGYEHIQNKDNVRYHVVCAYKSMGDYTVALGWYYVDVQTAEAFEWDLKSDKGIPLN
jgi:tetratricopeptide (TPR) repeat protein